MSDQENITQETTPINPDQGEGQPASGKSSEELQEQADAAHDAQAQNIEQSEADHIREKEEAMLGLRESAKANAIEIQNLSRHISPPIQNDVNSILGELERILNAVEHARSAIPAAPNPADKGMEILAKIEKIVIEIKGEHFPRMVAQTATLASMSEIALTSSINAQMNAFNAANAARNAYSTTAHGKAFQEMGRRLVELEAKAATLEQFIRKEHGDDALPELPRNQAELKTDAQAQDDATGRPTAELLKLHDDGSPAAREQLQTMSVAEAKRLTKAVQDREKAKESAAPRA